jgi:hypothetical protein
MNSCWKDFVPIIFFTPSERSIIQACNFYLLHLTMQDFQSFLFSVRFNECNWYLYVKPWPFWAAFILWLKPYWNSFITICSLLPPTVHLKSGVRFPAEIVTFLFLATSSRLWGTFTAPSTLYCMQSDRSMKLNARLCLAPRFWMLKSTLISCRLSLFCDAQLLRYAMLWKCTTGLFV